VRYGRKGLVLQAVIDLTAEQNGRPPSYREIAALVGVSVPTVFHHLSVLARENKISWRKGEPRSLRVIV
jgi:DNA-binding IscR family transcriptional regulator